MKILVLGGNRFFGIHLVERLLAEGGQVTLLNRGLSGDPYEDRVQRVICDRADGPAMKAALKGRCYDVVFDNIAYASKDVKAVLEAVETGRYVLTSSVSAYPRSRLEQPESDFDPWVYPLRWVNRKDVDYGEGKRQGESALFQRFADISAVAVRFPYVVGPNDYTRRLAFYGENLVKGQAMYIDNLSARLSFIHEEEAGRFLAALAKVEDLSGPVNAAATGTVSLAETLDFLEKRSGKEPILLPEGLAAPYNGSGDFGLDTSKAREGMGYAFSRLQDWYWDLLENLPAEYKG